MSTFRMSERCAGVASLQEWKVSAVLQKKCQNSILQVHASVSAAAVESGAMRTFGVGGCGVILLLARARSYCTRSPLFIGGVKRASEHQKADTLSSGAECWHTWKINETLLLLTSSEEKVLKKCYSHRWNCIRVLRLRMIFYTPRNINLSVVP